VLAWLVAAALPVALLIALFSWADTGLLTRHWPLGIRDGEVLAYAAALDRSARAEPHAMPDRYLLTSAAGQCPFDGDGPGWGAHWFESEGYGDSVKVRRLRTAEGGLVIKFQRADPFRAQRHIVLVPADWRSMRAKYLEVLAGELGVIAPEVSFVRLIACGVDRGIYLKEERIDADFLEKQGLAGASLCTLGHDPARPDHLLPVFDDDTLAGPMVQRRLSAALRAWRHGDAAPLASLLDAPTAVGAWLLRTAAFDGAPYSAAGPMAYDWSRGRLVPLFRQPRGDDEGPGTDGPFCTDPFTVMLRVPALRAAVEARREALVEQRWKLKERFEAMDRSWLPIIAEEASLRLVKAMTARLQEELIERIAQADIRAAANASVVRWSGATAFDPPMQEGHAFWPQAGDAERLTAIAKQYKARISGDTLVFGRGVYHVDEDLVLPYGAPVLLLEGARFEIAEGRSVVVQGPLEARGTPRNPVFVRPRSEGAPFGSFAVIGTGRERVLLRGLLISGGSEARFDGLYFSGMLAIHDAARAELRDCTMGPSHGEDALNIKDAETLLRDCIFEDGKADLVDLDRCRGRVERCIFRSGRRDSNGDGLDVSGGRIAVLGCTFLRMMDKGISAGEASQLLVRDSRFEGNRLALAAKDLSVAYAEGNAFSGNEVVFGAYRKKPIYGGARVVRGRNEYAGNARELEADALSTVGSVDALDERTLGAFLGGVDR
jgi:hypothetical protein